MTELPVSKPSHGVSALLRRSAPTAVWTDARTIPLERADQSGLLRPSTGVRGRRGHTALRHRADWRIPQDYSNGMFFTGYRVALYGLGRGVLYVGDARARHTAGLTRYGVRLCLKPLSATGVLSSPAGSAHGGNTPCLEHRMDGLLPA